MTATDQTAHDQTDTLIDEPPNGAIIAKVDCDGELLRIMQRDDSAAADNAGAGDDPCARWFTMPDDVNVEGPWSWDGLDDDLCGDERLVRLYREGEVPR